MIDGRGYCGAPGPVHAVHLEGRAGTLAPAGQGSFLDGGQEASGVDYASEAAAAATAAEIC